METQSDNQSSSQPTEADVPAQSHVGTVDSPSAPQVPQAQPDAEVARLEELLRERAAALRGLEAEHARQAALMRDLAGRFDEVSPPVPASGGTPAAPAAQVDRREIEALRTRARRAGERALEAEAARVEAVFKLDEVMGALREAREAAPVAEVRVDARAEADNAQLEGTARGLQAALAEITEARDIAEARLMLAEHDLEDARGREMGLERRLLEMRDQLELQVARAHTVDTAALAARDRELAALGGERAGLELRAAEAERALETLGAQGVQMAERLSRLGDQLGSTRAELGSRKAESESLAARINEMELHLARERKRAAELRQSVEQANAGLSARESEASTLRSEAERLRQQLEQTEVGEVARRDSLRAAASTAEADRQRVAAEAGRLRAALGETRDALVALGVGVEELCSTTGHGQATEGLETVAGDVSAPDVDDPSVAELHVQLKAREERINQLERQQRADADTHTASLASHRAQLELSRGEAGSLREQLSRQQARLDAARAAARSIRSVIPDESDVRPRVAELLQLLSD